MNICNALDLTFTVSGPRGKGLNKFRNPSTRGQKWGGHPDTKVMMAERAGRLLILKHYIISDGFYLPRGRTLYLKVLLSPRQRTVSDAAFIKGRIGTNYPVDRARTGKYGGAFSALIAGCAFTFVTYKHFYQVCVYSWDAQICRGDYPYHLLWVSLHVCYSSSSGTTPSGRGLPAFTLICFNPYRCEIPHRILIHIRTRKWFRDANKHSITEVLGPEPIRNGGYLELVEKKGRSRCCNDS